MSAFFPFIFVACLAVSFLLSGMEAGVFALSRIRIRQQMRAGNRRARVLYEYLDHPENFLWTILVGNTLANLLVFSISVLWLHMWLGGLLQLFWMAFIAVVLVFYALIELLPKMIFRMYPNRLCMSMALPFRVIHLGVRPLVWLMAVLSKWVMRFSKGKRFTGHLFGNRDELRLVMQESAHGFTSEEKVMINRVLDLQNLTVRELSIPMAKVVTVSANTPVSELLEICRQKGLRRLPVWDKAEGESGRRIIGLVNVSALIYESNLDTRKVAGDFVTPAPYLGQETRVEVAMRRMQRRGQRLGIVVGADGLELGIVSLQDILNFMFGEVSL